ncbi:Retrovirus-related Pol polyprotein from transposon TNT 1-94 [Quillaja saponaria]|uniref:Retrovirus-related Pol polyprotein from transposon TNT 1-94 n=1 Tax=Quillaja saponaria TaxID=32244 RepID=A0AAD7QDJ3_QUISA|nr:Retrovirus-related Pol polyprotein from transposon TNT 1-94 [Quillaja saponaria]
MDSNNSGSSLTNFGMEKLVGTNYNYWRLCMEAFLQGQDLWDLVDGADLVTPQDILENVESRRKWKIKCGKVLFVLRMSVGKEHIDHIQMDVKEPISEARLRRYLIRGLRNEHMSFITSVQGWASQPSVEELENLLANQEALAKQMSLKPEADDVLFLKEDSKSNYKNAAKNLPTMKDNQLRWRNVKCYRCGKLGHIKRNYRVKLGDESANVVTDETYDQLQWEQCLSTILAETQAKTSVVIPSSINFEKEWVIDSGCSHDVTGN